MTSKTSEPFDANTVFKKLAEKAGVLVEALASNVIFTFASGVFAGGSITLVVLLLILFVSGKAAF